MPVRICGKADIDLRSRLAHLDLLQPNRRFYSFHRGETELGYGGIEGSGQARLIRSLIVLPGQKKSGVSHSAAKSA